MDIIFKTLVFFTVFLNFSSSLYASQKDEEKKLDRAIASGDRNMALMAAEEGLNKYPGNIKMFTDTLKLLPDDKKLGYYSGLAGNMLATADEEYKKEPQEYIWPLAICKISRLRGMTQAAVPYCEAALRLNGSDFFTLLQSALVYKKAGQNGKAIEMFEESLTVKPDYYPGFYELGMLYKQTGEKEKAKTNLKQAIKLSKEAVNIDKKNKNAKYYAVVSMMNYKHLVQEEQDRNYLRQAEKKLAEGKAAEKKTFKKTAAVKTDKISYGACLKEFRAQLEKDKDDFETALKIGEKCRKQGGRDQDFEEDMISLLLTSGRYEDALLGIDSLLASVPAARRKAPETYYRDLLFKKIDILGRLKGTEKKIKETYAEMNKAYPDDYKTLTQTAEYYKNNSDIRGALGIYKKILKLDPNNDTVRKFAEEIETSLMTPEEILSELKLRGVVSEQTAMLQQSDLELHKEIRQAEIYGAREYIVKNFSNTAGLLVTKDEDGIRKLYLTMDGYNAYLKAASMEAINLFEDKGINLREMFKLRDTDGEKIFREKDPYKGLLSTEGIAAWLGAKNGVRTWLLSHQPVSTSPQAQTASKEVKEAEKMGYTEISEPEYIWLMKTTTCPQDVLTASPINIKEINNGVDTVYMMCFISAGACANDLNMKIAKYIINYRNGNAAGDKEETYTGLFGSNVSKRPTFCKDGKIASL